MAEIKSTLEIIMEKTKGLTPTDEEKDAYRKKEVRGKTKGFLMNFLDGFIDLENLKKGIASFEKKDQTTVNEVLISECLDRIDPEEDNTRTFDILEHVAHVDIASLKMLLSDFLKELKNKKCIREQELSQRMQGKGVSGSAILPNLKADNEWTCILQEVRIELREKMESLMQNISHQEDHEEREEI